MKSSKEHLIASLIIVMSFIVIGISVSYAFYENVVITSGETGLNITSGNGLVMSFESTQYINAPISELIKDNDILTKNQYTSFSVSGPTDANVNTATYNLYLTDITMTCNFKTQYLKWALYSGDGSSKIQEGDFADASFSSGNCNSTDPVPVDDLIILNNKDINKGETDSYRLYMWLSYHETELQNDLLEGSISAKVGFKGITKNT